MKETEEEIWKSFFFSFIYEVMELFKKLQMASFLQAVPFGQCSGFGWQFNNEANKHVSRKVFTILWDLEDHRHWQEGLCTS